MRISSSKLPSKPRPAQVARQKDERALIDRLPLSEAAVEMPEVLLGLSGLQDSSPMLGNALRAGIGTMALARSVQAFRSDEGALGTLEGVSSLGLAVAAGASLLPGGAAGMVGGAAEGIHGLCEMALGAHEIHAELSDDKSGMSSGLVTGILGLTKGATTFLPMFVPSTGAAVGALHLGILVTSTALNQQESQASYKFRAY